MTFSAGGWQRVDQGRGWRVVLVDHVAELRSLLAELLSVDRDFVVVDQAGDGPAALRVVAQTKPDLVLMDWNTPGVRVSAAVPEMRRSSPSSAIVVLSEPGVADVEKRALGAGADGFRVKNPHLIQTLVDDMRGLLSARHR